MLSHRDPYHVPSVVERMREILDREPGLVNDPEELARRRRQVENELRTPQMMNRLIQSVVWRQEHFGER
jgi:hypothetical protein